MTDRKLDNMDESAEDRSLGEVLRTLKRVDAPADFSFKVKARIAEGDPDVRGGKGWWPLPVYVYALAAVVIIGSAFVLFFEPRQEPAPVVASKKTEPSPINSPVPSASVAPNGDQEVAGSINNNRGTMPGDPKVLRNKEKNDGNSFEGGSTDPALVPPKVILPPGFNANQKQQLSPPTNGGSASVIAMLSVLGVDAKFEGVKLKIGTVSDGSVAEKTGLKAGDIIEAVDGKPINSTTKLGTRFDAKSFTVRRGAETLQLEIRIH